MSRLDEIKARAEQVHWTSTSIEQATARMASSAADVPWLLSTVECLTDLCGEFRKREERLNAEVERLRGWIDRSERQEARARRAEAEVARLTAERDAAIERLERVIDQWRKTGRAVISEMNRADKAEAERDALAAQVARVESLAGQWERLAVTAINPDSREWLQACAATLRECLAGWPKMHAALADSEADTTDTQPTDQEDQA